MSLIATAEAALLSQALSALPAGVVRDAGSLPGGWTPAMLKRALQFAPGVYVAFTGGPAMADRRARIDGTFELYAVTKEPLEVNRRTGSNRTIGGYELVEAIIPAVQGLVIDEIGAVKVKRLANLFSEALFTLGGTVYGIAVTLELSFPVPDVTATDGRDDFLRFHADYDIPDFTQDRWPVWLGGDRTTPAAPDAQDDVTLEGPL